MSVGLDIGSKTIKVVEIVGDVNKRVLKAAGIVGVTSGGVDTLQSDKEYESLAGIIKKLFQDAKIGSKDVAIALPEPQVFTRTIKFPPLSEQEIASAIKWEAEEYVPIPVKDAIIQHKILERTQEGNNQQALVLLVAAPRILVEKYVKILALAGLTTVGVETQMMAMARSLAPALQTTLVIDFGARSTDISIVKNKELVFSRSIPTAGEAFTRAIAQSLGVRETQAEEYKKTYGMVPGQLEGKVGTAITPIFRIIADEIKKAIAFYQSEEKGEMPSSIILSGGTAGLPEISPALTKMLGLEVSIANPFAAIQVEGATMNKLLAYAPLYSIAVGLALRGD